MAKIIRWNTEAFEKECVGVTMDLLEVAAKLVVLDAKNILQSKGNKGFRRPPYKKGAGAGQPWTARNQGAMIKTIRAVRKHGDPNRNIWIMAGNKVTWWAIQLEYGRGAWKGEAKPFLRPAMANAPRHIKSVLESGGGQTKGNWQPV
jgi:hypothetical protein